MKSMSDHASFSHDPIFDQTNQQHIAIQNRLDSYFQNKRNSKQQSQTISHRPSNQTMDFRILFTKPQSNNHKQIPHQSSNIQNRDDFINRKQIYPKRKVNSEYTLNKKQVKQSLSKKKLNLMEFKLKQLQQQVQLQLQKKIDVFKQNQQLQRQIKRIDQQIKGSKTIKIKTQSDDYKYDVIELQTALKKQKQRNKSIKKQLQRLKERKRTIQEVRIQYSSNQKYQTIKNTSFEVDKLKAELSKERKNYRKLKQQFQNNQQLQTLSSQLKKLRRMVQGQTKSIYRR